MDLKLVLHRTSIKSGKRSRVKNQSFKKDKVDATAKFPTSLNSSINRDEDLENTHTRKTYYQAKGLYSVLKRRNQSINNLENSFNCLS